MGKTKNTYQGAISDKLTSMEVGESFNKESFITEHWGDYDYYIYRSFDTIFANCKKEFPTKYFRCIKGFIHRLT